MFFLYQLILVIIFFLSPLIILIRILKNKEDKKRFKEKFGFFSNLRKKGKLIWFHGSSVGELMSIIPLIYHYENSKSVDQILITSSTLSSSKILRKYKFKKTIHQFFPIDFYFISKKFLPASSNSPAAVTNLGVGISGNLILPRLPPSN